MLTRYLSILLLIFFTVAVEAQIPASMLMKQDRTSEEKVTDEEKAVVVLSEEEIEKLSSPQATMRTFMNATDAIKNGTKSPKAFFDEAIRTFDLSHIDENLREMTGKQSVERLINTLDRISKVNIETIPSDPKGPKWYFRKQTVEDGDRVFDVEIAIEKNSDGAWRFSSQTVNTLGKLYSSVSHLKVVAGVVEYQNWRTRFKSYLPTWVKEDFLMFSKGQWLGFLAIFILGILALSLVRFLTTIYIRSMVKKEGLTFSEKDHYKSTLPFGLLAFSLVWMGAIRLLELDLEVYVFLVRAFYILIAFTSVWSALKIVDLISMHFTKIAKDTHNKFDDVLVPMLSKTAKVLVVAFGTILVAHSLTFDIGSILAGLGIGGVAVALAAKDTISNLFGSVTVIMDRPFLIGDYVLLDKGLEGTIEEVGFRSTRIRTPHQSLVSLPNNVLANMAIDNYGMRGSRRFKTFLQMEYTTPIEKLEAFCERVRYTCQIHPLIDPTTAQVYVNEMTDKSINILLSVFFKTTDGAIELAERHKLIMEILRLAKELEVRFAFPNNTLVLEKNAEEEDG